MFLTTHASAGIFIAQHIHNPMAVFGLSFASHFILDFIPHGDEGLYGHYLEPGKHRYRRAIIVNIFDVAGLIGFSLWAAQRADIAQSHLLLIGVLGSILPDFLSHFFPILHQRLNWLFFIRWLYSLTKPTGVRYLVRAQNWLHRVLHHEIVRRDIPFWAGMSSQIILSAVLLYFSR